MSPAPHRLLIVEDHRVMRASYAQFFGQVDGVEVVAMTETAEEALGLFDAAGAESPFDIALIDISLPGMDGLELVRQLHQRRPGLRTLVVTGHHGGRYEEEAAQAGADGFIRKGDPVRLLQVMRSVLGS
ncbi:MAG: response regulator transcription factor [Rhodothermales bacterium]|nr:response regulator transcription factor [Rhodothermales bacterium]